MTNTRTSAPLYSGKLKKIRRTQQFLVICVLLFVAVIFWIGVEIFASQSETLIDSELNKLATPLNPSLDTSVLDDLENKKVYTDQELAEFTIYKLVTLQSDNSRIIVPIDTPSEQIDSLEGEIDTNNSLPAEPTLLEETAATPTPATTSATLDEN